MVFIPDCTSLTCLTIPSLLISVIYLLLFNSPLYTLNTKHELYKKLSSTGELIFSYADAFQTTRKKEVLKTNILFFLIICCS